MKYYKNDATNEVFGYDETDPTQLPYMQQAIDKGYEDITGNWPLPYVPTPAEQAISVLVGGLTVNSAGHPEINSTYAVLTQNQAEINGLMTGIMVMGTFPNQATTYDLHDAGGVARTFPDVTTFKNFAIAVLNFVSPLSQYIASNGEKGSIPNSTVSIP